MIAFGCRTALRFMHVAGARLSIVLYHRVLDRPDPMLPDEPDIARFEEQMRWLRSAFNVLPLRDAVQRLEAGTLPAAALCITFDDGYRDNARNALPILQRLALPATFFVTTRYRDGGIMWNDRVIEAVRAWTGPRMELDDLGLGSWDVESPRAKLADRLLGRIKYLDYPEREQVTAELLSRSGADVASQMMGDADIRRLHDAGMEIGGHTVSHPILRKIPLADARREIADNKSALEAIIGAPVETFAFPNGRPGQDYAQEHVALVRECGYRCALSTAAGTANQQTDRWQLPRFTPWDRTRGRFLARMVQNYFRMPVLLPAAAGN